MRTVILPHTHTSTTDIEAVAVPEVVQQFLAFACLPDVALPSLCLSFIDLLREKHPRVRVRTYASILFLTLFHECLSISYFAYLPRPVASNIRTDERDGVPAAVPVPLERVAPPVCKRFALPLLLLRR